MTDNTTDENVTPEQLAALQRYAEMFDDLCYVRHEAGQLEYGVTTFLGNDVIRMMCEELADTANYARYQFIKLMILQDQLSEFLEGVASEEQLSQMGINSFRGAGKEWTDGNRTDPAH